MGEATIARRRSLHRLPHNNSLMLLGVAAAAAVVITDQRRLHKITAGGDRLTEDGSEREGTAAVAPHTAKAVARTDTAALAQTETGAMPGAGGEKRKAATSMCCQKAWMRPLPIRSQRRHSCSRPCLPQQQQPCLCRA